MTCREQTKQPFAGPTYFDKEIVIGRSVLRSTGPLQEVLRFDGYEVFRCPIRFAQCRSPRRFDLRSAGWA